MVRAGMAAKHERMTPPSPSYGATGEIRMTNTPEPGNSGTFLDCGGKRSATPLFFAQLRGSSRIKWGSMRGKSAIVATLCQRNPKFSLGKRL
ncbi:MAG: hypothetical protein DMF19_05530 [Verrucomicrobia bacterium]|nr:MAG: hypothetical protein DMF19_05530 [Verrucomicrobiota bacterium]